ncbi:hypothetical protein QAD02_001041 [Eretmocerus hayati]|uniref:Uncharacterized protein n=1 Tax=Eretmocerus hayati TaxID=131215 RepID=A0ACC2NF37_9HYME|nr:hypothetical protein QAD02_001041 [Eretmocerus hayati]
MSDVFKYPPFRNHDSVKSDLEKHKQLRQAIQHRDKDSVQNILKKGAFVNDILSDVRDVQGYQSPLHLAVISRCPDIVKMLLDNGASVDCKDWNYETPLMMAAKMQNTEVTDLLLTAELDNYEDFHGFSYLDIACMRGKVDVVRSLLLKSRGENLNSAIRKDYMYWTGFTPLHFAVHFEQIEVVELLLEYGADITVKDTR